LCKGLHNHDPIPTSTFGDVDGTPAALCPVTMSRDLVLTQPQIRPRWLSLVEDPPTPLEPEALTPRSPEPLRVETPNPNVARRPLSLDTRRDASRRALADPSSQLRRAQTEQQLVGRNGNNESKDGNTHAAQVASPELVWSTAEKQLPTWDLNQDGFLSRSELEKVAQDPKVKGLDAAVLMSLLSNLDEIQALSNDEYGFENDGITGKDLGELRKLGDKAELNQKVVGTAGWGLQKSQTSTDLFDQDGPNYDAVKQGSLGSCEFLSAAVALAKRDPEAIKKMISDNGDGSYTVRFPGSKDPIRVTLSDAELGRAATAGKDGRWIGVLEKAYGQFMNQRTLLPSDSPQLATESQPGRIAMKALTGREGDQDILGPVTTNLATTRKKLTEAMKDGRLVTAGIGKELITKGTDGLPANHQYTVLNYDPKTDQITLRNPWGGGELRDANGKPRDGKNDGVFTMSLTDFYARFNDVVYETRAPRQKRQ
jgi:hypothetical protein